MLAALLNAEKRFAVAALAPALMNAILLALLLLLHLGSAQPEAGARWLALCTSLTGLAHLAMILLALRGRGLPRLSLRWSPDMTRLVRTGGATLLAASAAQLVLLVATQIASAEAGAVAALYYADRVFQLPLGFVGVAMGTVVLSDMAAAADRNGPDATLGRALALGLALALPAAAALVAWAEPIVSVLFEHGRFGAGDRERTAAALAAFGRGLPFAVAAKVFGPVSSPAACRACRWPAAASRCSSPCSRGLRSLMRAMPPGMRRWRRRSPSASRRCCSAPRRCAHRRPGFGNLRPIAASLLASAIMLVVLGLLLRWLAMPCPDQPILHRIGALGLLCSGGLAAYALAGWPLGAFGALPLRNRRG
ncbi:putative lipid II flippase MurJ OS=Bosea thiooxidans OX=53254 GN=murJ PE=3 SV=1 [Bosea thiooxidans]